jgi:type I restriction enzyme M protein
LVQEKLKGELSQATSSRLTSIVKSARDIMRKDKGLSGEIDRLHQLTWIMFLKFLDDVEKVRQAEVIVGGKFYVPLIQPPYRWRDWASGITGNELIAFISNDLAILPDGSQVKGLIPYLRSLHGSSGRDGRDVIANVFREVTNRMQSGYLLRDVIDKVNNINFSSSEEVHVLGYIYESLLKELRDAAGDSGEFYTPRPVVKFMVEMIDPKLGETILDPAAGTGGFLVESFLHLQKQCKTTDDYELLQKRSLTGIEPKSLPFLLWVSEYRSIKRTAFSFESN